MTLPPPQTPPSKTHTHTCRGSYKWSGGKSVEVFDSTVIRMDTDEPGVHGWGENCPLGSAYLPAFAKGTRAGLAELAPALLGQDPTELLKLNELMDAKMKGHNYVKAIVDMACWDILGRKLGVPVCTLLGGRFGDSYPLYRAISQGTPAEMVASVRKYREEGYTKFQLKNGSTVEEDVARIRAVAAELAAGGGGAEGFVLMADFNTGLLPHEAVRIVRAVADVDVYIEQPCATYEECLSVRRLCPRPFILDENIEDIHVLLRIWRDQGADAINLKISKVGGITKARQIRDLCISLGIAMNLEDTWGGDIVTAAIAHLAHSTPPRFLLASTDFNSYTPVAIADGAPRRRSGRLAASTAPGLGVEGKLEVLGQPVAVYE